MQESAEAAVQCRCQGLSGVRSSSEMTGTWCLVATVGYVRGCSEDSSNNSLASSVRARTE